VAVVVFSGPEGYPDGALTAVGRQVYVPAQILVVGGGSPPEGKSRVAGQVGLNGREEVMDRLESGIAYVWFIHGDTRPRPDALGALIEEMVRNDASVAGSKVLAEGTEDRLLSVGEATDVFGEPYSGLEPGELDLEQYDVVREVSFVSAVSLLVRRDLLQGLRGLDPVLPLEAAGLDLSQRARLAGGRVIVVPSSEVFHAESCSHDRSTWRNQAGRQRAMLTAYRPLTLAWVVPTGFLVGLADGVGQLILGRFRPLGVTVAGWAWNIARLPSTAAARRRLAGIRQVGDEELFRFQVGGSVSLRRTAAQLGERFSRALEEGEAESAEEGPRSVWQRPSAVVVAATVIALIIGTRQIWLSGAPASGFSLLPGPGTGGLLAAYGGGWHASGLGSPVAAPPIVALGALVNLAVGDRPALALLMLTLGAVVAGLWGTARLARRIGAGSAGSHAAAWVYIAGAAATTLFSSGRWPLLLAAGPLPWALDAVMAPTPSDWRRRLGRYARGGLAAGLTAAAFPPALMVVPIVGTLWAVLGRRFNGAVGGLLVSVLGLGLIAPFVLGGDLEPLLVNGPIPTIEPEWLWPGSIAIGAVVGALLSNRSRLSGVALGSVVAAGGWLVAQVPGVFPGLGMAALLAASLGGGLLTAMLAEVAGRARWGRIVGGAAAALLLVPAVLTVAGGRSGMPPDQWSSRLGFVSTLSDNLSARVLVIGPAADLPGSSRRLGSIAYRLIDGDTATLDQGYLPTPRAGDKALAAAIEAHLLRGVDLRPGETLADFGVGWVAVMPGSNLNQTALDRQVDLVPRPVDPELAVYENVAFVSRAVQVDQPTAGLPVGPPVVWDWDGRVYRGRAVSGRIRLADNPDQRWGPEWAQEGWANSISGEGGISRYETDGRLRIAGFGSGMLALLLLTSSWWGRLRGAPRQQPASTDDHVGAAIEVAQQ
jgi:hypothetical protein